MPSTDAFNLVDAPWLPCLDQDRRTVVLGLREALLRAHELRELCDPSPLVTAALHRLLLAVLHRTLGPPSEEAWLHIWRQGRWDSSAINSYFDHAKSRFDLFDQQHPFYQTASVGQGYATTPATKLLLERASGNNATLFDHSLDERFEAIDPARAARTVVMFQAFAPGGLVSFEKGQPQQRSATAAPLNRGAMALVRGRTLFETLHLNLVQYEPEAGIPTGTTECDRPAWESNAGVEPHDRPPLGYLDYLTWQSRRLRLLPELDDQGNIVVRRVALMKGAQLAEGHRGIDYEQMLAYRVRKNVPANQEPFVPVGFSEDRAFWRDSQTLLDTFGGLDNDHDRPPRTLIWLGQVMAADPDAFAELGHHRPALDLLGLTGDRAKLLFWRHERLPLPTSFLSDQYLVQAIGAALKAAENGEEALRWSVRRLVSLVLAPETTPHSRQPDAAQVARLTAHLDAGRVYWANLEAWFRRLLQDLPDDPEPGDTPGYGATTLPEWRRHVQAAARAALLEAAGGFSANGRSLKAVAESQRTLDHALARLLPDAPSDSTPQHTGSVHDA